MIGDGFAGEVAGDKVGAVGHGAGMRWVLMLLVILAAVMGGEARAVVVMGPVEVSRRVGKAEEKAAEALRVESDRASRGAFLEVEEVAGLEDADPLALWFRGGLAVARSDCGAGQGGARPIEAVGLGDRVLTAEACGAQESGTSVMDPASWRAYSLRLTRADGTVTRVDLLRPAGWEQVMAQGPDGRRTIHLELPEMGVSGEAEVLAVSPCPPVEPGVGRVVTGTFRNERNHGLRALHVSVAGNVSCLRVTSGHPVWSVTRGAWIGAGELVPGEALAAWRGETVAVLANLPEADAATWNLEVEYEHVYRVGPAGILVHNTCPTPKELFEGGGGAEGGGQEIVRRFLSKADAKTAKKQGIPYDPKKGAGISTTTTTIEPVNPDAIRKMTGAKNADFYIDVNIAGKPRLNTATKAGHADIKVQADISPLDIVGGGRVPKSRESRIDNE